MNSFIEFLSSHAHHAHWFIFIGALLAGCNIPVSIDVLVIMAALLASQFVPENAWILYTFLLTGCYLSAWISYFLGRIMGDKLKNWKVFQSILSEKKVESIQAFYAKYGLLTFVIGRFIPFGIRNALFMTSGMSKMSFFRFISLDSVACLLWVSVSFTIFFHLGQNFETLWQLVKTANSYIFLAFSVAVIGIFWYKRTHRTRLKKASH